MPDKIRPSVQPTRSFLSRFFSPTEEDENAAMGRYEADRANVASFLKRKFTGDQSVPDVGFGQALGSFSRFYPFNSVTDPAGTMALNQAAFKGRMSLGPSNIDDIFSSQGINRRLKR